MIALDLKSGAPIYRQIELGFARLIGAGALARDEALPSVRGLAAELAINPNTVQKAFVGLEASGVIYCVKQKGCYVGDPQCAQAIMREEAQRELRSAVRALRQAGIGQIQAQEMLRLQYEEKGEQV